jgi:hypothetical protein
MVIATQNPVETDGRPGMVPMFTAADLRTALPYRKEYSAIRYPAELNRRPGWLAGADPVRERGLRPSRSHASFSCSG